LKLLSISFGRASQEISCKNILKSTRGVHFTILPASPCSADFYEIWRTKSTRRHNHVCQIFSRSVEGLRSSDTPKIAISYWLAASHLQQCSTAVRHCDQYDYAKGYKRQECRHTWLLHGTPQLRIYQCPTLCVYKRFSTGMGKMGCDKNHDNGKMGTRIMCWYINRLVWSRKKHKLYRDSAWLREPRHSGDWCHGCFGLRNEWESRDRKTPQQLRLTNVERDGQWHTLGLRSAMTAQSSYTITSWATRCTPVLLWRSVRPQGWSSLRRRVQTPCLARRAEFCFCN